MPPEVNDRPARLIYRYDNGVRSVVADPAVLWRGLNAACVAAGTTWAELCKRWAEVAPQAEDGAPAEYDRMAYLDFQGTACAVVRAAFGLQALDPDGNGLNEEEVMGVLADFLDHREKKGPSTASSPSGSAPTDGAAA